MCSSLSMYLHAFLLFLSYLLLAQPTLGTDMASTANSTANVAAITNSSFFIAKPGCPLYCGNVTVPYPFGFESGCYIKWLELTCNYTFDPPKLLLGNGNIVVSSISQTQVRLRNSVAVRCYNETGATNYTEPRGVNLAKGRTFSATENKFTVVGCNVFALIKWRNEDRDFSTGCLSTCSRNSEVLPGNCTGIGCCQIDIPKGLTNFNATATLGRVYSETETEFSSTCTYAFLGEKGRFQLEGESDFTYPQKFENRIRHNVPLVIDFVIENQTCSGALNLGTLKCRGDNNFSFSCIDSDSGYGGYLCKCNQGYKGNPYLNLGCTDINECLNPTLNNCHEKAKCTNTAGSFNCTCQDHYYGERERLSNIKPLRMRESENIPPHGDPTVFVDNLPIDIRKVWVYNLFSRFGKIKDIHIPNKRSKISGQGFCFVRFMGRFEADQAVANTNGIWVWDQRLMVQIARFTKKLDGRRSDGRILLNPRNLSFNSQAQRIKGKNILNRDSNRVSYTQENKVSSRGRGKEVWRKKNQAESSKQGKDGRIGLQKEQGAIKSIHLQPVGNGWLTRSAVGKIRRLISAEEIEGILKKEIAGSLCIKPLGGRFLILTFSDEETRNEVIKRKGLQLWFEELKPWEGEHAHEERFVWISCYGMPLNVWNVPSFQAIGSNWGDFIEVDENTLHEASYEKGRILIATENPSKIEGKIQLIVEGKRYMIRVEEEQSFRIVKSSKKFSRISLGSEGAKSSMSGKEDDDMDKKDADKDANRLREDKSGEDSEAEKRDIAAINEETYKAFTVRQNGNLLENSTVHAEENNQVVVAVTINTKEMDDRQLRLPELATNPILELVEVSNNEGSQFTHGLESIVQDSLKADLENETSSLQSVVQESEAQVIESQEGIYLHQEIEKNAGVNNSPGLLESNCQLRASQVQGINLQVELQPIGTRKEHRKKLRRQQYDNSQSQRCAEDQVGDNAESDSDEQRQAMLEYELQSTIDVGNRLGIRYEQGDIRAIKKMIEIEAKDYFLLQRNKTST